MDTSGINFSDDHLNAAILRLSAELRLEKMTRQLQAEDEKLLWECHKAQLKYIDQLTEMNDLVSRASTSQRNSVFLDQLHKAKEKLDGKQVNLDVVHKLVHQLEGRSQDFHINTVKLAENQSFAKIDELSADILGQQTIVINDRVIKELDEFNRQADEHRSKIENLQSEICATAEDAIKVTADRIHHVITHE